MAKQTKIPPAKEIDLGRMISDVQTLMNEFISSRHITAELTGAERQRLIGTGGKNYGFMLNTFDLAQANPHFLPPFFSLDKMMQGVKDLEQIRQLGVELTAFLNLVEACILVNGDKRFREALRVYDSLKEMTKNHVPGAQALYEALRSYFNKRRRSGEHEPTIKELEHDFDKLLHGRADGKIEIINKSPKAKAGVRKVIDEVHPS